MKRRNFKAIVTDDTGSTFLLERNTFAWNSAIKATQDLIREYARENSTVFHGGKVTVMEAGVAGNDTKIYRRTWTNNAGRELQALVWEVL